MYTRHAYFLVAYNAKSLFRLIFWRKCLEHYILKIKLKFTFSAYFWLKNKKRWYIKKLRKENEMFTKFYWRNLPYTFWNCSKLSFSPIMMYLVLGVYKLQLTAAAGRWQRFKVNGMRSKIRYYNQQLVQVWLNHHLHERSQLWTFLALVWQDITFQTLLHLWHIYFPQGISRISHLKCG